MPPLQHPNPSNFVFTKMVRQVYTGLTQGWVRSLSLSLSLCRWVKPSNTPRKMANAGVGLHLWGSIPLSPVPAAAELERAGIPGTAPAWETWARALHLGGHKAAKRVYTGDPTQFGLAEPPKTKFQVARAL